MTDQPTQEEIERVRAWQEQQRAQQSAQLAVESDARWEKRVAGLEGLVGATIVKVEYEREEKAGYSLYQGSDLQKIKIIFDTGAIIEYANLQWSESDIFNIKANEEEWIV